MSRKWQKGIIVIFQFSDFHSFWNFCSCWRLHWKQNEKSNKWQSYGCLKWKSSTTPQYTESHPCLLELKIRLRYLLAHPHPPQSRSLLGYQALFSPGQGKEQWHLSDRLHYQGRAHRRQIVRVTAQSCMLKTTAFPFKGCYTADKIFIQSRHLMNIWYSKSVATTGDHLHSTL